MPFPALKIRSQNRNSGQVQALLSKLLDYSLQQEGGKERMNQEKDLYKWKKQQDWETPDPKEAGLPQLKAMLKEKNDGIENAMMEAMYDVNPKRAKELEKMQKDFNVILDMITEREQKKMNEESDRALNQALKESRIKESDAKAEAFSRYGAQQGKLKVDEAQARIAKLNAETNRILTESNRTGKKIDLMEAYGKAYDKWQSHTDAWGSVGPLLNSPNVIQSPEQRQQFKNEITKKIAAERKKELNILLEDDPSGRRAAERLKQLVEGSLFGDIPMDDPTEGE